MTHDDRPGTDSVKSGTKAPWWPCYHNDLFTDPHVERMTWEERGVYFWLLGKSWLDGGIDSNSDALRHRVGLPPKRWARVWKAIAPCWSPHPSDPTLLVQARMEGERLKKDKKIEANRRNGQLGGRPRTQPKPNANPTHNPRGNPT